MTCQPLRVALQKRCSEIMQQIYRRTPMPKCDFTSAYVFSCKIAACFQNTFSQELLWVAAFEFLIFCNTNTNSTSKYLLFRVYFSLHQRNTVYKYKLQTDISRYTFSLASYTDVENFYFFSCRVKIAQQLLILLGFISTFFKKSHFTEMWTSSTS